jgi:hypothetical protein
LPADINDTSLEGHVQLLRTLRRALRRERRRGVAGHWTYDLTRHAHLLEAYSCERRGLEARLGRSGAILTRHV